MQNFHKFLEGKETRSVQNGVRYAIVRLEFRYVNLINNLKIKCIFLCYTVEVPVLSGIVIKMLDVFQTVFRLKKTKEC